MSQVLQGVPLLRKVEFEAKVTQDSVAFGQGEIVVSVMDGGYLPHRIYLRKLLALDLSSHHTGLNDLMRNISGKAERVY